MLPRGIRYGQNVIQRHRHIGRDDLQHWPNDFRRARPAMVPSQLMSKSPGVATSSRSVIVRRSRQIFQHNTKEECRPRKEADIASTPPLGGFYLGIRTWMRLRVVHVRSSHILRCVIKYGAVALSAIRLRLVLRLDIARSNLRRRRSRPPMARSP
jgi:hypothetical protein